MTATTPGPTLLIMVPLTTLSLAVEQQLWRSLLKPLDLTHSKRFFVSSVEVGQQTEAVTTISSRCPSLLFQIFGFHPTSRTFRFLSKWFLVVHLKPSPGHCLAGPSKPPSSDSAMALALSLVDAQLFGPPGALSPPLISCVALLNA